MPDIDPYAYGDEELLRLYHVAHFEQSMSARAQLEYGEALLDLDDLQWINTPVSIQSCIRHVPHY